MPMEFAALAIHVPPGAAVLIFDMLQCGRHPD